MTDPVVTELDTGRVYAIEQVPGVWLEVEWVDPRGVWLSGKVVDGQASQDPIPLDLEVPSGRDADERRADEHRIASGWLARLER